jgi:hypothetical protein
MVGTVRFSYLLIPDFPGFMSYHQLVVAKDYKYNKPYTEKAS